MGRKVDDVIIIEMAREKMPSAVFAGGTPRIVAEGDKINPSTT